jgi:hypothetical protein
MTYFTVFSLSKAWQSVFHTDMDNEIKQLLILHYTNLTTHNTTHLRVWYGSQNKQSSFCCRIITGLFVFDRIRRCFLLSPSWISKHNSHFDSESLIVNFWCSSVNKFKIQKINFKLKDLFTYFITLRNCQWSKILKLPNK